MFNNDKIKYLLASFLTLALLLGMFMLFTRVDENTRKIGFSDNTPAVYYQSEQNNNGTLHLFGAKIPLNLGLYYNNKEYFENAEEYAFCFISPALRLLLAVANDV